MPLRLFRPLVLTAAALSLAAPAFAQEAPPPSAPPPMPPMDAAEAEVRGDAMPAPMAAPQGYPGTEQAAYERARADWLAECRHRHGSGATVGGAVVGGVVGGLVGNRVAGHGHRTEGTLVGAAVGAVAGGALGAGADRRAARDYCEAYLDQHTGYGYGGYGYVGYGQAYALQPMMVMVPVATVPVAAAKPRECEETVVTEEWVDVPARRVVPRPPKRVPLIPDKRVRAD